MLKILKILRPIIVVALKFHLRSSINFRRCVPVAVTAKQDTKEKEIQQRERERGRESEGEREEEEEERVVRKEEKRVVRLLQNIRC